jgi:hypothetical protein
MHPARALSAACVSLSLSARVIVAMTVSNGDFDVGFALVAASDFGRGLSHQMSPFHTGPGAVPFGLMSPSLFLGMGRHVGTPSLLSPLNDGGELTIEALTAAHDAFTGPVPPTVRRRRVRCSCHFCLQSCGSL